MPTSRDNDEERAARIDRMLRDMRIRADRASSVLRDRARGAARQAKAALRESVRIIERRKPRR